MCSIILSRPQFLCADHEEIQKILIEAGYLLITDSFLYVAYLSPALLCPIKVKTSF